MAVQRIPLYFKDHAQKEMEASAGTMRVDFTAPLGGGSGPAMSLSGRINNKLRGR